MNTESPKAKVETPGADAPVGSAALVSRVGGPALRLVCALAAFALSAAFFLANPAFAQDGGGEIIAFVEGIRDFLIQLAVPVGTIGLIVCGMIKMLATSNTRMHELAGLGIRGCAWGVVIALGATIIVSTLAGFVPGAATILVGPFGS